MKKLKIKDLSFGILIIAISAIIVAILIDLSHNEFKDQFKDHVKDQFEYQFEDIDANINELYIYGNHLNIKGRLDINSDINKMELIMVAKQEKIYDLIYEKRNDHFVFYITSKKNNGLLLDNLSIGNHIAFLKVTDNNNHIRYYHLKNKTDYNKTEYYTISKNNSFNHILITQDKKDTLNIKVKEDNKKDIYDVVIDAGHGGIDSGACYKGTCETDFTLTLSKKLKEKLEKSGLKVKLTRDESIKRNQFFPKYGQDGRIDRAMSSKAKYLFSFHLNSGLYTRTGAEIYTTNNIDYTLAHSIVDSIVKNTNINYSNNPVFKVDKGIYTRTFRTYEINDAKKSAKNDGYEPYNITTDTTYYYIIRETGGIITGAYVDGREEELNTHYNTNVGIESYILELGYITNPNDTKDIKNNMDLYINAIAKSIIDNICE